MFNWSCQASGSVCYSFSDGLSTHPLNLPASCSIVMGLQHWQTKQYHLRHKGKGALWGQGGETDSVTTIPNYVVVHPASEWLFLNAQNSFMHFHCNVELTFLWKKMHNLFLHLEHMFLPVWEAYAPFPMLEKTNCVSFSTIFLTKSDKIQNEWKILPYQVNLLCSN